MWYGELKDKLLVANISEFTMHGVENEYRYLWNRFPVVLGNVIKSIIIITVIRFQFWFTKLPGIYAALHAIKFWVGNMSMLSKSARSTKKERLSWKEYSFWNSNLARLQARIIPSRPDQLTSLNRMVCLPM